MKLQQLKYLVAVVENQLNISAAAERLYTSQPAVSRQIRLLEEELGLTLFTRRGSGEVRLTEDGEVIFRRAQAVQREIENIERYSKDVKDQDRGLLTIATTQTHARYVLPSAIARFHKKYPSVALNMLQGTREQLVQMMEAGKADFVIATGPHDFFPDLLTLPLFYWDRVLLVPEDHDLVGRGRPPSLQELAGYPLVTNVFSDHGESSLMRAFLDAGLQIEAALTARDCDVIKTYVKLGLGVGVMPPMALRDDMVEGCVALETGTLFPRLCSWVGFRRDISFRSFMYHFLSCMGNHLEEHTVKQALEQRDQRVIDELFPESALPFVGLGDSAASG